jgi:IPT/TIG domain
MAGVVGRWAGASTLAVVLVAALSGASLISEVWTAQPAPTTTRPAPTTTQPAPTTTRPAPTTTQPAPTTTQPGVPLVDVEGRGALWFIGLLAVVVALLWAFPLLYDTREANRWRRDHQAKLLNHMINRAGRLSVEEIRQIVSAIDTQPRGTQNLTQSLLGLIITTFVGVALVATLVSTAADSSDLRKTVITALLSILATITGFYFGARTSETATERAKRPPESRQQRPDGTDGGGPSVLRVAPSTGSAGGSVVLTGSGFTGATAVNFGDVSSEKIDVDSDQQITATVPAGTGTVDVTVTTPAGTSVASEAARFTYSNEKKSLLTKRR